MIVKPSIDALLLLIVFWAMLWTPLVRADDLTAITPDEIQSIVDAAVASSSDALLISANGKTLHEYYSDRGEQPIELMSVLKSVVSLGIGRLIELGKISSIDQRVHEFYPSWNQGLKKNITIRHILNHTTGLQDFPSAAVEIYPSPNAVELALAAELSEEPGTAWRYNNKATNILAGIIEKAYGRRMDQFFVKEFFGSMGITQYKWYYDASGSPHAMAGLELLAADLAKFGELVLDGGEWKGKRLISESYIDDMLAQSQPHFTGYGLMWWRLAEEVTYILDDARYAELVSAGVDDGDLKRIEPILGSTFTERADRDNALESIFGEEWRSYLLDNFEGTGADPVFRREYGPIIGYYGDGYLGQTLLIVPSANLVAVRMIARSETYNPSTDGFGAFKSLVIHALRH